MSRIIAVVCAIGLWTVPVAAEELRLAPPTLTAHAGRCSGQLRSMCESVSQRAIETDLSCDACSPGPMPPEVVAPASGPADGTKAPDTNRCEPQTSGPLPSSCVEAPPLDAIPRP
ncbi:MAG: hypothetical protein JWM53_3161 [bacterium]|nr:hypothetical protein [bacterium]